MRVFRTLPPSAHDHVALTIGNFDGLHRGHQAMIARLTEAAGDLALPAAVMTFDPHPREFFAKHAPPPRLSTLRDKLERFEANGVDRVYIARFNAAFASLAPGEFIGHVLRERLGVRWLLVGEDFRFGKARAGDLATLRRAATDFSVEAMNTISVGGARASSTAVRIALGEGDFDRVHQLLGRPYTISGHVGHGAKLGRTLGFPTANIAFRHKPPVAGVFAVRVHGLGATPLAAAASVGRRPTVADDAPVLLEAYIFDFDEPIYGRRVTVEFLHKLRDEERFPDLASLKNRIAADVADARRFFDERKAA